MSPTTLRFTTIIEGRELSVSYDLFPSGRKLLMDIDHNGLPVDIPALRTTHKDIYEQVVAAMDNNARSFLEDVFERLGNILNPVL